MEIRVLAIINPTSGRGNITGYVEQIKKYLEKQNMTVKVKFTKKEYKRILFLVFLPIFYIFRKEL